MRQDQDAAQSERIALAYRRLANAMILSTLREISKMDDVAEAVDDIPEIAFVESLSEIWVSQMHPNVVHVFSLSDFSYKATIPSGGIFPKVLLAHPDGTRVFVSNWVSGTVVVIANAPEGQVVHGLASVSS